MYTNIILAHLNLHKPLISLHSLHKYHLSLFLAFDFDNVKLLLLQRNLTIF